MKIKSLIAILTLTGMTSVYAMSGSGYTISNERMTCAPNAKCSMQHLDNNDEKNRALEDKEFEEKGYRVFNQTMIADGVQSGGIEHSELAPKYRFTGTTTQVPAAHGKRNRPVQVDNFSTVSLTNIWNKTMTVTVTNTVGISGQMWLGSYDVTIKPGRTFNDSIHTFTTVQVAKAGDYTITGTTSVSGRFEGVTGIDSRNTNILRITK